MLAARFDGEELALVEVDEPEPDPDEVVVEVRAASICGSDVNYLRGKTEPGTVPITLGHEGAGVVAATGDAVDHVVAGDRVLIHYIQSCGHCGPCLAGADNRCRNRRSVGHHTDGTFAEQVCVTDRAVQHLPDGVPFAWGSVAGCAVATGYHAVERGGVGPGDLVVIFGAGGVGLHATLWADFRGAGRVVVVDPLAAQREKATEYGADLTVDPTSEDVLDAVHDLSAGYGADVTLECSGAAAAMEQAVDAVSMDNGYESGTAVSVGIQTESIEVGYDDVREGGLRVSGDHTRGELYEIRRLLAAEAVDLSPSVTHTVALADIHEGIDLFTDEDEPTGRVVVEP
jgi:D-arabinose 1-dehydrogenase-like Zn-dependent alcohol dehydrogenase